MDTTGSLFYLAKYAALLFVPYCLFLWCYRLFAHPLSKYPGPIVAKLSDAYAGFYAISMRLHLATFLDLEKYGPVIRHGPNRLVFSSAKALQDIYLDERIVKSNVYNLTVTASGIPSIFNVIDRHRHRVKRKLVGQAVNDKAMRDFEPTMVEQIDICIEQLRASSTSASPVNMTDVCKRLGLDIVALLAFGYPLKVQTDPTNRSLGRGIHVGGYQYNCFMQFPLLKKLRLHHLLLVAGFSQRQKYIRTLRQMISSRLAEDKHAKKDLYSFVVDQLDNTADGITTSELWAEAVFFFPAGGDTTSAALAALLFYLSHNPDIYTKLAEEIRNTFSSDADICGGPKLASCSYLRACIDETLRMTPPVSGTLWRELPADEQQRGPPLVIDGHFIPPGTQVGVCIYALHHNEQYFEEPFAFRPERWLDSDEERLSLMRSAFAPFSVGARGCAGKAMAYLETSLTVAKTMWHFDFETAPGVKIVSGGGVLGGVAGRQRPDEFQLYDIFAAMHDGPELTFRPRSPNAS